MIGIKTLARQLDLSIGTVSRALNGRPDVNADTRARVLEAAQAAGYRPNQSGRALRHGRTSTVGFVLETGSGGSIGGDNFFMMLLDSMQAVLTEAGLDLVLLPCRSADDPTEFLERQVARGVVDAIVLTATRQHDPRIALLLERRVPFLALGRSATAGDYPWIDLDFAGVAQQAVAHLAALGHRRIAAAAPRRAINLSQVFISGYRDGLAAQGLPFDPALVIRTSASENGGSDLARILIGMEQRPSAVILGYEQMAIGLYASLAQAGLQVGRDMSIIGFRDSPQLRFLAPALTCFSLDLAELGRSVGRSVLALLDGKTDTAIIWPMTLLPGASAGPPPD